MGYGLWVTGYGLGVKGNYAVEVTAEEIAEDDGSIVREQRSPGDIGGIKEIDTAVESVRDTVRETAEDERRYGKEER